MTPTQTLTPSPTPQVCLSHELLALSAFAFLAASALLALANQDPKDPSLKPRVPDHFRCGARALAALAVLAFLLQPCPPPPVGEQGLTPLTVAVPAVMLMSAGFELWAVAPKQSALLKLV